MSDTALAEEPVADVQPENAQETPSEDAPEDVNKEDADQPEAEVSEPEPTEDGGEADPKTYTEEERTEYSAKVVKNINRLTHQARTAQEGERGALERAEKAEARIAELEQTSPDNQPPKLENFDTVEEYVKAAVDHGLKAGQQPQEQAEQLPGQPSPELLKAQEDWKTAESAVVAKHSDYKDVVSDFTQSLDVANPDVSRALAQFVVESTVGPELIYEVATDSNLQIELMSMPAHRATLRIGQLEAKLLAPNSDKKVPDNGPPTKLKSTGQLKGDEDLSGGELRKKYGMK